MFLECSAQPRKDRYAHTLSHAPARLWHLRPGGHTVSMSKPLWVTNRKHACSLHFICSLGLCSTPRGCKAHPTAHLCSLEANLLGKLSPACPYSETANLLPARTFGSSCQQPPSLQAAVPARVQPPPQLPICCCCCCSCFIVCLFATTGFCYVAQAGSCLGPVGPEMEVWWVISPSIAWAIEMTPWSLSLSSVCQR